MGHTIHFVFFAQERVDERAIVQMREQWDTFTLIAKTINCPASTEGYELDAWYQEDIADKINKIIRRYDIDIVLINYIMQSKMLESLQGDVPKVIDTHDIFANRHLRVNEHIPDSYTWYSVSKEDEIRGLNRADAILAIQEKEAEYFASVIDRPARVIRHRETKHFLKKKIYCPEHYRLHRLI